MDMQLPSCTVQSPACGACGMETDHDGNSFYCDDCGLDYGDGDERIPATYREEDALACGNPCDNYWHGAHGFKECRPCTLPKGHISMHWTPCQP